MRWCPHPYQKAGIQFGIQHACAGLIWDPGLGKTTTMLAIFKLLKQRGMVKKMLVITPLRPAYLTWPAEAQKWDEFKGLDVRVIHGATKTWRDVVAADVAVINPEGLGWLFTQTQGRDWPWQILCVDESTRFKHTNTQRFKMLRPVLEKFSRRYILTGTPAPNGLLDLFGQIFILDLGHALGRFITHYRTTFFTPGGYGNYTWTPQPGSDQRIYKRIAPLIHRLKAEDWLSLPPLVFNEVEVELPEKARKVYEEMEALMISELETGKVVAANAAAVTGKCRQIANGGVYGLDGGNERVSHHLHDAKTDAVEEVLEELQGTPALISYEFDHDLERLLKRFPGTPHIGGGVTPKRFKEIETEWNAGRLERLFAQPSSVAHGLNLQGLPKGAHIIRHSIGWDLEVEDQFIRRIYRQGYGGERLIVHSIKAKNTVDVVVLKALARKDRTQKALLDALKENYRGEA